MKKLRFFKSFIRKIKFNKFIFKLWEYILFKIKLEVDKRIFQDEEIYVVYLSAIDENIYVCRNGQYALELFNQFNKLYLLINRPLVKIFYGKADVIFKFKIPQISKLVFTYDISPQEQRKLCSYIADIPIRKGEKSCLQ